MAPRPRTTPRKAPKQARAQETVEAILTATARVLVNDGYDRASTNRIAKAAGVSVGSLYQYFPSKEALVAALVERHIDRCLSTMEASFTELAGSPPEQVARGLIEVMVQIKSEDPALERVLLEQVPRVGRLSRVQEVEERMARLIRVYLEGNRANLRPIDPEAAAFLLAKAGNALAHGIALDRPTGVPVELLMEEFLAMVTRYLLPEAQVKPGERKPPLTRDRAGAEA